MILIYLLIKIILSGTALAGGEHGGGYLRLTAILITRGFFQFAPCWPITMND